VPARPLGAVLFDVFGTVVDWRTGVAEAGRIVAGQSGEGVDWGAFADAWRREGYLEPIAQIVTGARPYSPVEALLAEALERLVTRHGLELHQRQFAVLLKAWRRLDPWPDARPGLDALRRHVLIAPLSNGSFALLTEMAKRAGLPWDCIISTELFAAYKPDPTTYRGAVTLLDRQAEEVMLVAAHLGDLRAASDAGLRTAYVPRPAEWGEGSAAPAPPDDGLDMVAEDLEALAERLATEGWLPW
jgi:2-haloacid dehalogenase